MAILGDSILERALPMTPGLFFRAFSFGLLAISAALMTPAAPALAAVACGTGSFEAWLADFKTDAAAKGISPAAIASGLNGVTLDRAILARDHSQQVFSQSFEEFSGRMVPPRLGRGSSMMKQYGSVLGRIEQTYGVPGEVLVAIWGLETDYGVNIGKFPTFRSLATLAYDCRRSEMFRAELMDALRIVERGDLAPQEMRGAWAGELGQTQFMPSSYIKFAVDFDQNGRRDLLHSAPDVLASTANFLASYGWQRGKDWSPGSANFAVIQQWNKSEVYAKTVGYFATQLAHAP
jgi:lytic murein transglycosylase